MGEPTAKSHHQFGNYEILSVLGKGGMAEVYRARVHSGPRAGWTVAIKRLAPAFAQSPGCVEQFTNEADLSRLLDHPHIVKVFEVGVIQDIYFMAMELVEGSDLGRIIRRCKRDRIQLPVDFAVYLASVLLEALAYAHAARSPSGKPLGIVHCDVSPSNLFISRNGETKLGDFGVARALSAIAGEGPLRGKPYYLSPEVFDGQISPWVDLWAANVTLYELLTLERPFQGHTQNEVGAAVRAGSHRPVRELRPDVTPGLAQIIERGFERSPANRFGSAAEFAQALAAHHDDRIGNPMAIAAVVRGMFGASA